MYRLVLYYLIILIVIAIIFGFFKILPYTPVSLIISALILVSFSMMTNWLYAKVFNAQTNTESAYITSLILVLLVTPVRSFSDIYFLIWVAILSEASKYILAIKNKHIFNPAAIAIVLTVFAANQSASWWVGNMYMMPFVMVGGLLIVRKIRREDMVNSFILVMVFTTILFTLFANQNILNQIKNIVLYSSIWFLGFVMLTEPQTTPPTKILQIIYGGMVGFLMAPQIHISTFYFSPALALVIGNLFVYFVSPKEKLILKLKEKIKLTDDIYDFVFDKPNHFNFHPGQYMEWTLGHKLVDSRGNRRYFTLASSPTEDTIRIGIKFRQQVTSFKRALLEMKPASEIIASQLCGDFTLPKDQNTKLVFIAGGIGITPFRSMLKYLIDNNEKRDIVLLCSNKFRDEIVYSDVFNQAENQLKIKIIYTLTDKSAVPSNWQGEVGRISEQMIIDQIRDYKKRLFYISGPHAMVEGFNGTLHKLGVKSSNIKSDYFPGFV